MGELFRLLMLCLVRIAMGELFRLLMLCLVRIAIGEHMQQKWKHNNLMSWLVMLYFCQSRLYELCLGFHNGFMWRVVNSFRNVTNCFVW
jgi:hypothetical protein